MAKTRPTSDEKKKQLLELASLISHQVEIETVFLAQSSTRRGFDAEFKGEDLRINMRVSNIKWGTQIESDRILVMPSFVMTAAKQGETKADSALMIEASFVLIYTLKSLNEFDRSKIQAFAVTNGVFNAWPYWREFVQNTVSRMGLPAIIVPVFRL